MNPQRAPKPPPFPIGTKLICVANRGAGHMAAVPSPRDFDRHPEDWIQTSGKGLRVVIDEVQPGRRGTGEQLRDDDGLMYYDDDQLEPIIDETKDGCSVFHVVDGHGVRHGRLIHYKDHNDWEVIHGAQEAHEQVEAPQAVPVPEHSRRAVPRRARAPKRKR